MKIRFYKHNNTYGGSEFIDYDTAESYYITGNTASTAEPLTWYELSVEVATKRELSRIQETLELIGIENRGRR